MAQNKAQNQSISPSKANKLLDILRRIQSIDAEFPLQYAICLVQISQDEGCSLTQLAEKTNLALSTVSRIVGALSAYRQVGEPYGFVEVRLSPAERRKKELYLTPLGQKTLQNILFPLET